MYLSLFYVGEMWLQKCLVRSVIFYARETQLTSKEDKRKLTVLGRKFLWPKKNDQTVDYKKRSNNKIKGLSEKDDIIQTLKEERNWSC